MIALINKTSFYRKTVERSSKQALRQKSGAAAKASLVVRAQKVDVARRRSATAAGRVLAAGAAALTIAITPAQPAMAYDLANIVNSTNYNARGTVSYAACRSDDYNVTPNTRWYANSRGACLLTKVTAIVKTPGGEVEATSYTSSGTSYASFAVISVGDNVFEVTRRVT